MATAQRYIQLVSDKGRRDEPMQVGFKGTLQTLKLMGVYARAGAVDERVRSLALRIVAGIPGHQFRARADALFAYCRDSLTYERDPKGAERVQSAAWTLFKDKAGDCDDKSTALIALAGSIGITGKFVIVSYKLPVFHHVYVQLEVDKGLVNYDPTREDAQPGWEGIHAKRYVYGVFGKDADQLAGFMDVLKKIGKVALVAAPIALAPFTGGASLLGVGAAAGAGGAAISATTGALLSAGIAGAQAGIGMAGQYAAGKKGEEQARDDLKEQTYGSMNQIKALVAAGKASPSAGAAAAAEAEQAYFRTVAGFTNSAVKASANNYKPAFASRIADIAALPDRSAAAGSTAAGVLSGASVNLGGMEISPIFLLGGAILAVLLLKG